MDVGPFYSATIASPGEPTLKGIAIKVGDNAEGTVCFDTELLRYSAGWTGGFLRFDPARYGLIKPPEPDGKVQFRTPALPGCAKAMAFADPRPNQPHGPLPRDWARYRGMFLSGKRVVLSYTVGSAEVYESPWIESARPDGAVFSRSLEIGPSKDTIHLLLGDNKAAAALVGDVTEATIQSDAVQPPTLVVPPHDRTIRLTVLLSTDRRWIEPVVARLTKETRRLVSREPGPRRWTVPIITRGNRSRDDQAYVIDTIELPFDNPYRALFFPGGHDFFPNGDAAVCTVHGDVWLVRGIDDDLDRIEWTRFATGLFQPLGLKIVEGKIHVLGRDQITRLHDRDGNGEADYYENLNNEAHVSINAHEYSTCLETDSAGDLYFLKGNGPATSAHHGCLLRVARDGSKLDVVATGFRNANGLSIGPDDVITVAPQEGEWTPASAIFEVKRGAFHGAMMSHHLSSSPTSYVPPLCWIPRRLDNSSGGQVWVTSEKWGPLNDQLLHFSYGQCSIMHVLREPMDGRVQGGVFPWPLRFDSGVMRGRFHPVDGQLYVTGLRGWVSNAAQDGCFQRVRFTGKPVDLPLSFRTMQNGIAMTFSRPLDKDAAENPGNYHAQAWNYRWSEAYGSPEFKPSDPRQEGRDDVEIVSATLLDERTVFLEIPDLKPVMQLGLQYSVASLDKQPIEQAVYFTIHATSHDGIDSKLLVRRPHPGQLPKEIEESLRPGVVLSFNRPMGDKTEKHGGASAPVDADLRRLPAIHLSADQTVSPFFGASDCQGLFRGYLQAPLKHRVTFTVEGDIPASLKVNGVTSSGNRLTTTLHKGFNAFSLDFDRKAGQQSLRLDWESESFAREPVPPQIFRAALMDGGDTLFPIAEQLRLGRELFSTQHCAKCHELPADIISRLDQGMLELASTGPDLSDVGNRLNTAWLTRWLLDPSGVRNDASMPMLFDATRAESVQAVDDLVAYLATLRSPKQDAVRSSRDLGSVAQGEGLFQSLGCIACHRFTPPGADDDYKRVTLHYVPAKFGDGALRRFLKSPREHYEWTRMPDFHLDDAEAGSLAAYIVHSAKGTIEPSTRPGGDAARGRELFQKRQCLNCHPVKQKGTIQKRMLAQVIGNHQPRGCLAGDARSPNFRFEEHEKQALRAFLGTDGASLSRETRAEASRRLFRRLNCVACHHRDTERSPRAVILDEEGSGEAPELLPDLTWAGEKLRPAWTEKLLAGTLGYRPRPWLKARMPSFPAYATLLARGMSAEHGFADGDGSRPAFRPELAAIGHKLSLQVGGLDCVQCHGIGSQEPRGDDKTKIALGINFAHIPDRLRHSYYRRFVLDPPRVDPSTKMPKLAADGKHTTITGSFDGDASLQFDAIWHYIQSLRSAEPAAGN